MKYFNKENRKNWFTNERKSIMYKNLIIPFILILLNNFIIFGLFRHLDIEKEKSIKKYDVAHYILTDTAILTMIAENKLNAAISQHKRMLELLGLGLSVPEIVKDDIFIRKSLLSNDLSFKALDFYHLDTMTLDIHKYFGINVQISWDDYVSTISHINKITNDYATHKVKKDEINFSPETAIFDLYKKLKQVKTAIYLETIHSK